jgi:tRNA G18 (ribose-2'-O)-methylase SpoU
VHKIPDLEDPVEFFKSKDIQPFLIEQGGVPLESMNFKPYQKKPVCFIMGSEGHGIPDVFAAKLPKAPRLTISQYGMIRSLNVSIAGSIVMYEYLKQMRESSAFT